MKAPLHYIGVLVLVTFLALGSIATAYAIIDFPEEKFVQRVSIAKVDLTHFTDFKEVSDHLQEQKDAFMESNITWTSERGEITLSMQQMGITPETEETQTFLNSFMDKSSDWQKIQSYMTGMVLEYPMQIDAEMLKTAFAESGIEQGSKSAAFAYENGEVLISPEQIGYGIDEYKLNKLITSYWENSFTVPSAAELPLLVGEPEWLTEDFEAHLEAASELASLAFNLADEEANTWQLPLAEHMDWILPNSELGFDLNPDAMLATLESEILSQIESEPQSVVITEDEEGIHFEGSARFGKTVDKDALLISLESNLDLKSEEPILLTINITNPEVTLPDSLKERGITDLIGVGDSNFSGSPYNRIYNINFGADIFNGIIVPQGEEFSFTQNMGLVDEAHGWRAELVIKGDETIPEAGGGICQISTTAFRAALFTGLDITDRRNHSYAVSYYGQDYGYGLDSTVYQNAPDSKWINDTEGDILMQAYTEGSKLYFVFYGTPTGRTVKMDGPYLYNYRSPPSAVTSYTDELASGQRILDAYGHTGFEADWYRTIIYADGTESEPENFHSTYRAMPAKYVEGRSEGEESTPDSEATEFAD